MSKSVRVVSIVAVLLAVLTINLSAAQAVAVAEPTGLPCYDMWQDCLASGHSDTYCEGVWCGCMKATYGYDCDAVVVA